MKDNDVMTEKDSNNNLFKINNLSKTYGDKTVLAIEELDIPLGLKVAIVGNSGSGKTTFVNLITGFDEPDQIFKPLDESDYDQIQLDTMKTPCVFCSLLDKELEAYRSSSQKGIARERELRKNKLFGYIFQDPNLLNNFDLVQNINIPLQINGRYLESNPENYSHLFGPLHIKPDRATHYPEEISRGEMQRIAFARALIHDPTVVFADEPTSNIDYKTGLELMKMISLWQNKGTGQKRTLVWVTHNIQHASRFADYIIVLGGGMLLRHGPNPGDPHAILNWMNPDSDDNHEKVSQKKAYDIEGQENSLIGVPENRAGDDDSSETTPKSAAFFEEIRIDKRGSKLSSLTRFMRNFVLTDLFPRQTLANTGKGIYSKLVKRRYKQVLNTVSLFFLILLGLFFFSFYTSLEDALTEMTSDPRINRIEIVGKKFAGGSDSVLKQNDLEKLSQIPNTAGAFGVYQRLYDFYINQDTGISDIEEDGLLTTNWYDTIHLDCQTVDVYDPILTKITLYEGDELEHLRASRTSLDTLFIGKDGNRIVDLEGIIITRDSLVSEDFLNFKQRPDQIKLNLDAQEVHLPLLAITESLPGTADVIITEGWFKNHFAEISTEDEMPGYDKVMVYISNITSAIAVCERLQELHYTGWESMKANLEWINGLLSFLRFFLFVAIIGLSFVAMGNLFVTYANVIQNKQLEIGILLAMGIKKIHLYLIFILEVLIIWIIALFCSIPVNTIGLHYLRSTLKSTFQFSDEILNMFTTTGPVFIMVAMATFILAIIAVYISVNKILRLNTAQILKRSH